MSTSNRSEPTPSLGSSVPLPVVTALTTWLGLFAWSGFVESSSIYLAPALIGIMLTTAAGVLARLLRLPGVVVVGVQALVVMLYANMMWGSSLLPTPESVETVVEAFRASADSLGRYAAPVPADVFEVAPVLVLGGLACHLLVDLCASTLRRVPVAGLPLLVIYTLPIGILDDAVNPVVFALTVAGFLTMLALQEGHRIARWGLQFGAPTSADPPGAFGARDARRHPVAIGAAAVVLAVVLPIFIPTLDLGMFGQRGSGAGSGDQQVQITNPMTDLRRDLVRGEDTPLLTVRTKSGETPSYLRTTVLTTYTGEAWTPGNRDLPSSNDVTEQMPAPLPAEVPRDLRKWDIEVSDDLDSLWLPTPLYAESIRGAEDWRYDERTLDVHAATDEMSTQGMDYSVTQIAPEISAERLADASPARAETNGHYLDLPSSLPDRVEEITQEVVSGSENDFERASALQRWFREGGGFEYSTARAPGNGNDALLEFLEESRVGYCEQFASAMAVMARSTGIPARVAVGFFRSEQVDENEYEFSSHDLHAWPELYFEETGWVRFEPTPSSHIPPVPEYSDDQTSPEGLVPSDSPSTPRNASPSPERSGSTSPAPQQTEADARGSSEDSTSWWGPVLGVLAVLVLLGAVALAPRAVRRRRSVRRWSDAQGPVEAAWAELADSALDLGLVWPTGLSPRATGDVLARSFAAPLSAQTPDRPKTGPETNPRAVEALAALVRAVEEARFAPAGPETDRSALREQVEQCVQAWRGGVSPRARFRADWWPRSVIGRRPRATAPQGGDADAAEPTAFSDHMR